MTEYRLTDKWPEPIRGKKLCKIRDGSYVIDCGDYQDHNAIFHRIFVETNSDLFEKVDGEESATVIESIFGYSVGEILSMIHYHKEHGTDKIIKESEEWKQLAIESEKKARAGEELAAIVLAMRESARLSGFTAMETLSGIAYEKYREATNETR